MEIYAWGIPPRKSETPLHIAMIRRDRPEVVVHYLRASV